jgi:Fic-DOC domain mobile mystery protein B
MNGRTSESWAREWAIRNRTSPVEMATDDYTRELHEKMFDQTWRSAGEYRRSEKNIGVPVQQIRERLVALLGDVRYWIEYGTYPPDEISVRFHHKVALIHPFPNGNGRHARLIANVLVMKLGRPELTWGSANLVAEGPMRGAYLDALDAADHNDTQPLLTFARS